VTQFAVPFAKGFSNHEPNLTKPTRLLTLKDRLSRLTFRDAAKLLGPDGNTLLRRSANRFDFTLE
jgi:hypothetical protein